MQAESMKCSSVGSMKSIGIFGGTFDPVHLGHLQSALEVKHVLGLSELRLIPCGNPSHRMPPTASVDQRLAMLHVVSSVYPELTVDDSELRDTRISYTFNTITRIMAQYSQARIFLIIGVDAFQGFTTWYQWRKILQLCHIVVLARPDYELDAASLENKLLNKHRVQGVNQLQQQPCGAILTVELTQYQISATEVRKRIAQGQSIKGLVPDVLVEWICENKLYR